jgi:hypothetical protein
VIGADRRRHRQCQKNLSRLSRHASGNGCKGPNCLSAHRPVKPHVAMHRSSQYVPAGNRFQDIEEDRPNPGLPHLLIRAARRGFVLQFPTPSAGRRRIASVSPTDLYAFGAEARRGFAHKSGTPDRTSTRLPPHNIS